MPTPLSALWPLDELHKRYPEIFTKSSAGYLLRTRAEPGGVAPFLRWIGRVPYTSDELMAEWVDTRQNNDRERVAA